MLSAVSATLAHSSGRHDSALRRRATKVGVSEPPLAIDAGSQNR